MLLNKYVGLRNTRSPYIHIWVVIGGNGASAGQLKCCKVHHNVANPSRILQMEWTEGPNGGGREDTLQSVSVRPFRYEQGWRLLQECFEAEGMQEEWEEFQRWEQAVAAGRTKKEFPEDLLPQYVLDLRERAKSYHDDYKPQVKPRARKKATRKNVPEEPTQA